MASEPGSRNPVLLVGGGAAGITAALDLANAGRAVHLVERGPTLGGQIAKLDKLYPTDHCAFCPLWTEVHLCRRHPLIRVHTLSFLKDITQQDRYLNAIIVEEPHLVDESRCIFCGRCVEKCPVDAIESMREHAYPRSYVIDADACNGCGECMQVCPTGAIDIHRQEQEIVIAAEQVIWATGFGDADISPLEEYGYGTHPDIMSSLEFEEWIAEAGTNKGAIITRHSGSTPRSIAFIQCAGARDKRMFPYCSAVCCMHALKQAQWVKRRSPAVDCVIFYTDLRTEGRHYYEYYLREVQGSSLTLIRGRPGLIHPLPSGEGIAVRYEDTLSQTREMRRFDMVVLNGALQPSLTMPGITGHVPALNEEGFLDEGNGLYSACGFCKEPVDVETSVVQASSAALHTFLKREGNGQ